MKFEGNIKLVGAGEIVINVPAGELLTIKDKTLIDTDVVDKNFPGQ